MGTSSCDFEFVESNAHPALRYVVVRSEYLGHDVQTSADWYDVWLHVIGAASRAVSRPATWICPQRREVRVGDVVRGRIHARHHTGVLGGSRIAVSHEHHWD